MAKYATPRDSIRDLETVKYAHNAAVEAYETLVVNGNVLVATHDYAADEEGIYIHRGRVEFDKLGATAIPAGTAVYWDDAAKNITNVATANTRAGICAEDAAAADATILVALHEN